MNAMNIISVLINVVNTKIEDNIKDKNFVKYSE